LESELTHSQSLDFWQLVLSETEAHVTSFEIFPVGAGAAADVDAMHVDVEDTHEQSDDVWHEPIVVMSPHVSCAEY
jgi:hypothetical protein